MRRSLVACLAVVLASGAGCTAVIGPHPGPGDLLPCWVDDGFDPCPDGSRCRSMPGEETDRCVPNCVMGALEVCNNYDDDCDMLVDEPDAMTLCPMGAYCLDGVCVRACEVDGDMDTFTSCGSPADCDDTRADISPSATEVCDGIDNDCNPATTDATVCGSGETCAVPRGETTPRCIVPDCTNFIECDATHVCDVETGDCVPMTTDCRIGTATCTAMERCDQTNGTCITLRDLGETCSADVQCGSERCIPFSALAIRPGTTSGGSGMCSQACCVDADCPASFRCWTPGTGVRACVPSSMVPIDAAVEACAASGTCPGEICDVRGVTSGEDTIGMFICTMGTSTPTTDYCESTADCSEGFCFRPSTPLGTYPEGWCGLPCRTSADCDYAIDPFVGLFAGQRTCRYAALATGERLQLCLDVGEHGAGGNGASCSQPTDCRDAYCRVDRCSGICCSDGDCNADEVCAAVNLGGWEMRCVASLDSPG